VEIWIYRLTPWVKFGEELMTVPARYALLDKVLADAPKSYRQDMFGYDVVATAPDDWYEMVALANLKNVTQSEWKAMPLEDRGKHLAYLRLSGMIALIERHMELQDRERKQLEEKARKKRNDGSNSTGENSSQYEAS